MSRPSATLPAVLLTACAALATPAAAHGVPGAIGPHDHPRAPQAAPSPLEALPSLFFAGLGGGALALVALSARRAPRPEEAR